MRYKQLEIPSRAGSLEKATPTLCNLFTADKVPQDDAGNIDARKRLRNPISAAATVLTAGGAARYM